MDDCGRGASLQWSESCCRCGEKSAARNQQWEPEDVPELLKSQVRQEFERMRHGLMDEQAKRFPVMETMVKMWWST